MAVALKDCRYTSRFEVVQFGVIMALFAENIGSRTQLFAHAENKIGLVTLEILIRCLQKPNAYLQCVEKPLQHVKIQLTECPPFLLVHGFKKICIPIEIWRTPITACNGPPMFESPFLVRRDFDFAQNPVVTLSSRNRDSQPNRALRGLYAVPVIPILLEVLDGIKVDISVAQSYFMKKA